MTSPSDASRADPGRDESPSGTQDIKAFLNSELRKIEEKENLGPQRYGIVENLCDFLMLERYEFIHNSELFLERYRELDAILSQIKDRSVLDQPGSDCWSSLHRAVLQGRAEVMQLLLFHGAALDFERTQFPKVKDGLCWGFEHSRRETLAIISLFTLPEQLANIWFSIEYGTTIHNESISTLLKRGSCLPFDMLGKNLSDHVHVHVPISHAPTLVPIVRVVAWHFHALWRDAIVRPTYRNSPYTFPPISYSVLCIMGFFFDGFSAPAIAARDEMLNYREVAYQAMTLTSLDSNPKAQNHCFRMVFPYLALGTAGSWRARREQHTKAFCAFRSCAAPLLKSMGLGEASNAFVYCERTLDETYYPGLDGRQLEDRNDDQVIFKQIKREAASHPDNLPLLLVPQLWFWKIGNVLVSGFGNLSKDVHSFNSIVEVRMALIIRESVINFGKPYKDPESKMIYPSALDIFESALITTLSDVRSYLNSRKSQDIDINTERQFIEWISDIRNELDMIQSIIVQQEEVIDDFLSDRVGLEDDDGLLELIRAIVDETKARLAKYTKRISKIDKDAERISKTIDDMLNLSRTEASITEARNSIKEARNSVLIGWAALAFAVITIIFTPLSFVASLMALPVNRFADHQYDYSDDTRVYKSGYLAKIFVGAEVASLIVTGAVVGIAYWIFASKGGSQASAQETSQTKGSRPQIKVKETRPGRNKDTSKEQARPTHWSNKGFVSALRRRSKRGKQDEEARGQNHLEKSQTGNGKGRQQSSNEQTGPGPA